MSVVRRASSTFDLNDIFSETTRPRCLIFTCSMKYCLVDLYQVCSNRDPRVQNGGGGSLRFVHKKSTFPEVLGSGL